MAALVTNIYDQTNVAVHRKTTNTIVDYFSDATASSLLCDVQICIPKSFEQGWSSASPCWPFIHRLGLGIFPLYKYGIAESRLTICLKVCLYIFSGKHSLIFRNRNITSQSF